MVEKDTPLNEVAAACEDAKRVREAADQASIPKKPERWPLVPIGVGVGIGSAALAAALLYTNQQRRKR